MQTASEDLKILGEPTTDLTVKKSIGGNFKEKEIKTKSLLFLALTISITLNLLFIHKREN